MSTKTFTGAWGNNLTLDLRTSYTQTTAGNYSTVSVQVYLKMSRYGMIDLPDNRTLSLSVDGRSYSYSVNADIGYGQTKQLGSYSYRINHNTDGSKPRFNVTASLPINFSNYGSASVSNVIDLPQIKRTSTSSNVTGTIGNEVAITINRYSSSLTHTLKYDFKGDRGTIATGVATSYSWTIPEYFADLLPTSTSGTGTLIVETFDGNAKVGENRYSLTVKVPETATFKPTLSGISVIDQSTTVPRLLGEGHFVRFFSDLKVIYQGATAVSSASIVSYQAEIVNHNKAISGQEASFGGLDIEGEMTIRAKVVDSRGFSSEPVDYSVTLIDYFLPIVVYYKVSRSRQNPNILQLSPIVRVSPLLIDGKQKNRLTLRVSVAPYDSNDFKVDYGAATKTWSTLSALNGEPLNLGGTYDKSKSWLVKIELSDIFTSAADDIKPVSSESVLYCKAPIGMAFGKIWERGTLDVAGDIYANNKPIQHHQLTDNNGLVMRVFDANLVKSTGFYYTVGTRDNVPGNQYGYLTVWCNSDNFMYQMFTPYNTSDLYTRRMTDGVWSDWTEYVTTDHRNLVNTGWIYIGNSFYYKQVGDLVYLKYNFRTNGVARFSVGNIPTSLVSENMMFSIAAWTLSANRGIHLQVNSSGLIEWLNPSKWNESYNGQITWSL